MSVRQALKKASPEQAFLKVGWYGAQASGKTLTSLMVGEWLVEQENKADPGKGYRMAFVDTERGTDFYTRDVPERKVHPKAFDFDRIVTRSVYEVKDLMLELKKNAGVYKVVVIDSVTHIWDAAKEAFSGKLTSAGTIPYTGWGSIKKPIKMINECGLNGQFHYMFAGREGLIFEKDEDTGEDQMTGYKMKAESETPYEPHVLIQMYQHRFKKKNGDLEFEIRAFVEKDRSGVLQGQVIKWPTATMLSPLYGLLAGKQGTYTTVDDAAAVDARKAYEEIEGKASDSVTTYEAIRRNVLEAKNKKELEVAWSMTKGKKKLLGERFDALSALVDGRLEELNEATSLQAKAKATTDEAIAERAAITKEN